MIRHTTAYFIGIGGAFNIDIDIIGNAGWAFIIAGKCIVCSRRALRGKKFLPGFAFMPLGKLIIHKRHLLGERRAANAVADKCLEFPLPIRVPLRQTVSRTIIACR